MNSSGRRAFRSDADRKLFVTGHALLRWSPAQRVGGDPRTLRFHQELDAKPALVDAGVPPVDFNLSHSGEWVALAIGVGTTVGIDIEVKAPMESTTDGLEPSTDRG